MRQGWFKRTFGWIGDDFRRLVVLMQQPEMWILLGIIAVFATLVYYAFRFALNMDFTMRLRNLTASVCSDVGNAATAFLFFDLIFLGLTISMVFGEFARHLDFKRRKAYTHARSAAYQCAGWSFFALCLGLSMLLFLNSQCL